MFLLLFFAPPTKNPSLTLSHNQKNQKKQQQTKLKLRLRSLRSDAHATIVFHNASPYRVRALWLDFEGHEVAYNVIEPGQRKLYRTYCTHPWVVREVYTGARMLVGGAMTVVASSVAPAAQADAEIAPCPPLAWTVRLVWFVCFLFVLCVCVCGQGCRRGGVL